MSGDAEIWEFRLLPKSNTILSPTIFIAVTDAIEKQQWLAEDYTAFEDLLALCDNDDQRSTLVDLISRFTYSTAQQLKAALTVAEDVINNEWKLSPSDTLIAPLHNDEHSDSSQTCTHMFKGACARNGIWPENNFISSMPKALHLLNGRNNLILVDEFIGSGDQAKRVLDWVIEQSGKRGLNLRIYVVAFASMIESRALIDPLVVKYWSSIWMGRAISDYYGDDAQSHIDHLIQVSSKLLLKRGLATMRPLGHKATESNYKLDISTTPDNVFALFHWRWLKDGNSRNTILPPRS